jgi:tetratricopeptide (TPR) repeat protein
MRLRASPLLAVTAAAVLAVAGVAVCFWILVSPGNPLTRLFRRPIETSGASIVIGPYPLEEDFPSLEAGGVKTIVTLLNPELPYEGVLLERERRLAERYGIEVRNFPMSSIFGQRFGADYEKNADAAAQAILESQAEGKVYLHCYLGLHRIETVRSRLAATHGGSIGLAEHRDPDRPEDARRLDEAERAYRESRFEDARAGVAAIASPNRDALVLAGWSAYRLGLFDEAKAAFERAAAEHPGDVGAATGLGFALLQEDDPAAAERSLRAAVEAEPDNGDALYGLALALFRLERPADALPLLERVLAVSPDYAEARELREQIQSPPETIP